MPTTYDFIAQNKRRTWLLVLLFPLTFALMGYLVLLGLFYAGSDAEHHHAQEYYAASVQEPAAQTPLDQANAVALAVLPFLWAGAVLWIVISYFSGDHMLLRGAGAMEVHKADQPELYRLVENLCIAAGLPVPRIYIINDASLNAFATGRDPQHASVAMTKGIVQLLDRAELEGVVAHELSHIKNRDIRLMLITVAGISFCTFLAEVCFRMGLSASRRRRNSKDNGGQLLFFAAGLFFALYGYLVAPLIRLAVSRTREYQADASAALLTRHPAALARALEKISTNPYTASLQTHASMAAMCIENPLKKAGLFSWLSGLLATHPPTEKRIAKLRAMDAGAALPKG